MAPERTTTMAMEQQALRRAALKLGLVAAGAGLPVCVAWLHSVANDTTAVMWAAIAIGFAVLRPLFIRTLDRIHAQPDGPRKAAHVYAAYMGLSGLIWGALALLMPTPITEANLLVLLVVLLTIAVLSVGLIIQSQPAFIAHLLGLAAPLALRLAQDSPLPLALLGVLMFCGVLIALHRAAHLAANDWLQRRQHSDALLREQEAIFDTAVEAIFFVKQDRIVKCNRAAGEMLNARPEEVAGTAMSMWHEDRPAWFTYKTQLDETLPSGGLFGYTARLRRSDSSLFWAELSARAVNPQDLSAGVVWMGSDITGRLRAEQELRAGESRFRRLVSFSSDWYWEQDAQFRFVQISGARIDHIFPAPDVLVGKRRWELSEIAGVSDDAWAAHRACLEAHLPFNDFVYQVHGKDGSLRWVSISGCAMHDEHGRFCGYHGVGADITERVQRAERYHHLAHHDALTGLPNRRLLDDRLQQAAAQARRWNQRVVVMVIDLDDFKVINDSDGHATGDRVLVTIAQRLRNTVREADTVARFGGDEFVILLPEVDDPRDAVSIAEKILVAVSEPVTAGNRSYYVGASIGVAIFPDHSERADKLLSLADAAMYQAKNSGGSACHFAPGAVEPQLPLDFRLDGLLDIPQRSAN